MNETSNRPYGSYARGWTDRVLESPASVRSVGSLLMATAKRLDEADMMAAQILDKLRGPEPVGGADCKPNMGGVLDLADENANKLTRLLQQLDQINSLIG